MANTFAIYSVGNSLVSYLRNSYPDDLRAAHPCEFRLLSSGEIGEGDSFGTTLSLYLFRVTMNPHRRSVPQRLPDGDRSNPLTLDLHYMLTVWAAAAQAEQVILAWAMRQLHLRPILDRSYLSSEAQWEQDEAVQLVPSELTVEEMMRIWDSVTPSYRISAAYTARVVQVGADILPDAAPVVATRFAHQNRLEFEVIE